MKIIGIKYINKDGTPIGTRNSISGTVRVQILAPTYRQRRGCTPQPSYIHGPWVTNNGHQYRVTHGE